MERMKQIPFRAPRAMRDRLRLTAKRLAIPQNEVVRLSLDHYLDSLPDERIDAVDDYPDKGAAP